VNEYEKNPDPVLFLCLTKHGKGAILSGCSFLLSIFVKYKIREEQRNGRGKKHGCISKAVHFWLWRYEKKGLFHRMLFSGLVAYISRLNESQIEILRNHIKNESRELARIIDKAIGLVTETKGSF